jgi:hypothetical protein
MELYNQHERKRLPKYSKNYIKGRASSLVDGLSEDNEEKTNAPSMLGIFTNER